MEKITGIVKAETWRNVSAGVAVVTTTDKFGERHKNDVAAGQIVHITAADRALNDNLCHNREDSLFRNGVLAPVDLDSDTPDIDEIKSNLNLITEDEIVEHLNAHWKTLQKIIAELDNTNTLVRFYNIAVRDDLSNSKIKAIRARIKEVNPLYFFNDED